LELHLESNTPIEAPANNQLLMTVGCWLVTTCLGRIARGTRSFTTHIIKCKWALCLL